MNILIIPDSLKESMSAKAVGHAMAKGVNKVLSQAKCIQFPFSDGGEGALSLLESSTAGTLIHCKTENAVGEPIQGSYFLFKDRPTAWIELSQAAGLAQLQIPKRNPLITSTYGVGLLIKDALSKNCKEIILGIGGSATNDGAAGIFQALGGSLLDSSQKELPRGGAALSHLSKIIPSKRLEHIQWKVACDVENPLLGPQGASYTYAQQKGASTQQLKRLEKSLTHFAQQLQQHFGRDISSLVGGGAAGGTAAGMHGFFGASLTSGFSLLSDLVDLEEKIKQADLILTAEGKIDTQSLNGKVPVGVARLAKKYRKPCIGIAGAIVPPFKPFYQAGFTGLFNFQQGPLSLKESIEKAPVLIQETTSRIVYLYHQLHST